jgi:starch synthase
MFSVDGVEFYGQLSFLKAGVYYADHLTTVSPTYAREIQTQQAGWGLHGLLRTRAKELTGIVNGIDARTWNPARDPLIHRRYSASSLEGKSANKAELQREAGLALLPDVPLFAIVSRLTGQKGLDLVLEIAPALTQFPGQLVLLGDGEADLTQALLALARAHPRKISVTIGFDEDAAHRIIAGADIFLMPSRFEPCGLSQMYSQRYGTVPIVHAAGGLLDTVEDYTGSPQDATGFVFQKPDAFDFLSAVRKAVLIYRNRSEWRRLQENGMRKDFGWEKSARAYAAIYRRLVDRINVEGSAMKNTKRPFPTAAAR